nr:MAG TPA: apolipoprotein [Caudoviricetes sp.]
MDSNLVTLTVDNNLRTITVPQEGIVFGVVGDVSVNRVCVSLPRYFGGFDMSEFIPRVNYVNPNGDANYYEADDMVKFEDTAKFTWLMSSDVTSYMGDVKFSFKLYKKEGENIIKAFNTMPASGKVREGYDVEKQITPEQQTTLLSKLEASLVENIDSHIEEKLTEAKNELTTATTAHKNELNEAANSAEDLVVPNLVEKASTEVDEHIAAKLTDATNSIQTATDNAKQDLASSAESTKQTVIDEINQNGNTTFSLLSKKKGVTTDLKKGITDVIIYPEDHSRIFLVDHPRKHGPFKYQFSISSIDSSSGDEIVTKIEPAILINQGDLLSVAIDVLYTYLYVYSSWESEVKQGLYVLPEGDSQWKDRSTTLPNIKYVNNGNFEKGLIAICQERRVGILQTGYDSGDFLVLPIEFSRGHGSVIVIGTGDYDGKNFLRRYRYHLTDMTVELVDSYGFPLEITITKTSAGKYSSSSNYRDIIKAPNNCYTNYDGKIGRLVHKDSSQVCFVSWSSQTSIDYIVITKDNTVNVTTLSTSGVPVRIEKTTQDTTAALDPNKLYVFPEMTSLTYTLTSPSDASVSNEYHFVFRSGATATELVHPTNVSVPDNFTVESNRVYEISILEGCLTYQSWTVS